MKEDFSLALSVTDRIRRVCDKDPNRIACKVSSETISYRELINRAYELSLLLVRQGTAPVILRGDHSINEIIAVVSCLMARRAYVSIGTQVPGKRCREIEEATGAELTLELDAGSLIRQLEQYRDLKPQASDNETAYIVYTSGSTGAPKGIPISYGNLESFIRFIGSLEPLSEYDNINVLNQAALGFDLSVADLYYSLCFGHTWVAEPHGFLNAEFGMTGIFDKENIHAAIMTPSALKMCLLEDNFNESHLPNLKAVFLCGERLEKKPVRKLYTRFSNVTVINAYGPSEACSAVCAVKITEAMLESDEELPVGDVSTAATKVYICDDEIVLKGASVFGGYLDGRKGEFFKDNGENAYRTGDFGYIRDGLLYYTGRKDNQVKYKGYRIELEEIESRIRALEGVVECAVVARKAPSGIVKFLQAFVVSERARENADIKDKLSEVLPRYMLPKSVIYTDNLPKNGNGKIDRKALENYD